MTTTPCIARSFHGYTNFAICFRRHCPRPLLRDLDETLAAWPQKRKQFHDIEADLQCLDAAAWAYLKAEVAPLLITKHRTRGLQPLFDKLNQAKAWRPPPPGLLPGSLAAPY